MSPGDAVRAYIGMGANVGDRLGALRSAVARLDARADTDVADTSHVYETEAHVRPGAPPQPDHLNAVVALDTRLAPLALLDVLHGIERSAGRDHSRERWAPRPLDLDILLYGRGTVDLPGLSVPHPALADRAFVLLPLADVAPGYPVPSVGRTVADALRACPDRSRAVRTGAALR